MLIGLAGLLHPVSQLCLEVALFSLYPLQLLMNEVESPHKTRIVVLKVANVLSDVQGYVLLGTQCEVRGLLSEGLPLWEPYSVRPANIASQVSAYILADWGRKEG